MAASSKILIAPLDWGLGHTTRCIPLIRYLRQQGHQVVGAAEGAAAKLLQENFPDMILLPLEGYRIRYSSLKQLFILRILLQVPQILRSIRREQKWLRRVQQEQGFDLVISDNRYGLYLDKVKCCILTHQLQIKSGRGAWADNLLRKLHYRMLNRFDACWVVDEEGEGGLSGDLAHPLVLPPRTAYIGLLSQFDALPAVELPVAEHRILVLLSGPEPMRGQLESLVLAQAAGLTQYEFIVVAGNPLGKMPVALPSHIQYHTHLAAAALAPLIRSAALVICRSGYSTVMDLTTLGKRALLVPTPGQTEQEYLAAYLQQKQYYTTIAQQQLQLAAAIPKALQAQVMPARPSYLSSDRIAEVVTPYLQPIVPQQ